MCKAHDISPLHVSKSVNESKYMMHQTNLNIRHIALQKLISQSLATYESAPAIYRCHDYLGGGQSLVASDSCWHPSSRTVTSPKFNIIPNLVTPKSIDSLCYVYMERGTLPEEDM